MHAVFHHNPSERVRVKSGPVLAGKKHVHIKPNNNKCK